jgi:urate oxidase
MSTRLLESSYGKSRVRLTKVSRNGSEHRVKELSVNIQLQGEFDLAYTEGNNSQLVATDTMRNTVYALAAQNDIADIETFAKLLGTHFVSRNNHISLASIEIAEDLWTRVEVQGKPHGSAFVGGSREKRVTHVDCLRSQITVESGIEDLIVMKTAGSEFSGFLRDEFTTLSDTRDRIFATSIAAHWAYKKPDANFDQNYEIARKTILEVFAQHHSLGVQQTLFAIGDRVLEACSDIEEIRISMPNQHRIAVDVSKYGLQNKNEIFVPTDEPFGLISATMSRVAVHA